MELIAKLGIDWKLLLAQVVNFGIVLAVLTFFVYRPLLNLLDARSERIRKAMEDAKRVEHQKKEREALRQDALKKIDQECGAFLEHARQEAERMRADLLAAAKRETEELLKKGRQQLIEERAKVFGEVRSTVVAAVVRASEKILEREFRPEDQHRFLATLEKDIPTLLP